MTADPSTETATRESHRRHALEALSGIVELNHSLRGVRAGLRELPRYSDRDEAQSERADELDRLESRLTDERTELLEIALLHGLLALSAGDRDV